MKKVFQLLVTVGLLSGFAQASNTDSIEKVLTVKDNTTAPEILSVGHKGSYAITCSGFFGKNKAELWFNQSLNLASFESNKIILDISFKSKEIIVKKDVKTFEECTLLKSILESSTSPKTLIINSATDFDVR